MKQVEWFSLKITKHKPNYFFLVLFWAKSIVTLEQISMDEL